jgi:Tc toxin complex TcA C-terminal TcB-binding domain/Neuraminidase-like domain
MKGQNLMPDNQDITLKILVLDAQGKFRGGTVNVDFEHRTLSEHGTQRGLDASREINIAGLRRAPTGDYKITVTPTDVFERHSEFVNIPASGVAEMKVTIGRERIPDPQPDPTFVVKGTVRTAADAPLTNALVRTVHQTASGSVLLGEGKTDNKGNYQIKYSSALVTGAINLRVQVFDENAKLLAHSDPITPAKREEVVNLTLPPPEPAALNRVEGKVSRPDETIVIGAVAQAFDVSTDSDQFLGKAITDAFGHFKISYPGKPFEARGGADLIVRVFDARGQVLATSAVIRKAGPVEQVSLVIDDEPPVDKKPFIVRGTVHEANGKLTGAVMVRAFDCDLRNEELLGETRSDAKGNYEIRYGPQQFRRAEKGSADLRVAAFDDQKQQLVSSPIVFNARSEEIVNLSIGGEYRGPSEFENLLGEIEPLLQDVPLHELIEDDSHQDITFLANESGQNPQRITFLVVAHRLSRQTGLAAEAFYGFFREGLPTSLPALLAQSPELLRRVLVVAVGKNIIPSRFGAKIDEILEALKRSIVKQTFEEPADGDRSSIGALLATTLEDVEQREAFLTAYVNHTGPIEEFWHGLQTSPTLKDHIEDIQFTLQLGALTGNHLPLVHELKRRQKAGEIAELSDLTRFDEHDWQAIIAGRSGEKSIGVPPDVPGGDQQEKVLNYARAMSGMVEDAFPTAFITRRLETDDLAGGGDLISFLNRNPGFNLKTTRVDSYLKDHPHAFGTIADVEGTKNRIKAMQRVYKLAPRYAHTSVLMKDGHDSAYTIVRAGLNAFMASYGDALGAAPARDIYEKAQQTHAVALNLLVGFGPMIGRVGTRVVPEQQFIPQGATDGQTRPSGGAVTPAVSASDDGTPDWITLFGSLDLCDCCECQSVHSPAAYLVDALHFLKYRLSKTPPRSARDILLGRRPDLGEIELTCDNTNTPLPYVDLVNEVLEDAVAPPHQFEPFALPTGTRNEMDSSAISENLKREFTNNHVPLSDSATTNVKRNGEWWTIDDLAFTYTVHAQPGGALQVATRSRQTSGAARERAANQQYVNKDAYIKLRDHAVFPWTLPFDLWSEETRTYLAHLGVQRAQIMEAFLPGERRAILNNFHLACEYLGLTAHEAAIITGSTTSQPGATSPALWNLWGFDAPNASIPDPANSSGHIAGTGWLTLLGNRVDVFLQQSGLTYREMLDLLDTHYINPPGPRGRTIQIVSTDSNNPATCETIKLKLEGFDLLAAGKIVRFVRLWRKLGWSMRDLDRAVTAFSPAELNERFITELSHVERLHRELGIPVIVLLSWWGLIDTALYTDHSTSAPQRVPSLYAQLFRNRAITNPLDPDFPEDATQLDSTQTLSDNVASITAALGISAADFALLLNDGNVIPTKPDPTDPAPIVENKRRIPDDSLKLDYLSKLLRHTTLAKSLKLSVLDYLTALRLIGADPFAVTHPLAATTNAVMFIEKVSKARDSGFSLAELNYLLRHEYTRSSGIGPDDHSVAAILDEIRSGLQKIAAENTFGSDTSVPGGSTTDPTGELTRQKLALLNWSGPLIEMILATMNDGVTYETDLNSLPTSYEVGLTTSTTASSIPVELRAVVTCDATSRKLSVSRLLSQAEFSLLRAATSRDPNFVIAIRTLERDQRERQAAIKYDTEASKLRFTGVMSKDLRDRLRSSSPDPVYRAAIEALFDAPRQFIQRAMRTFSVQDFAADLTTLPPGAAPFPKALMGRIYFDAATHKLHFLGPMLEAERDMLLALSDNTSFQRAVNALFALPNAPTADFIIDLDIPVFDDATTPEARFELVLKKLLPYLRLKLSEQLVVQKIAAALGLESRAAELLLTRWVASPAGRSGQRVVADFLDSTFAESSQNVKLDPGSFPSQFKAYTLLHKIALIAARFKLNARQLAWLFEFTPAPGWLDLRTLPTAPLDSNPLPPEPRDRAAYFDRWLRLVDLIRLRDSMAGEIALDEIFEKAQVSGVSQSDLLTLLCDHMHWNRIDLDYLTGGSGFNLTSQDFRDERALVRLRDCFNLLKRLGMSARQCRDLAAGNVTAEVARAVVQSVRAKYDEAEWLQVAKPLRDVLREKQRAALVAYLTAHPTSGQHWKNANDLYAHFLIDVEMSPCMMTSRIKQAIGSTQLFVQRCLMNLEREVAANATNDPKWLEWKWMKNYRVWEANRKVFLYPENWIEPELRDDKSPLFKDLEGELLQSDLSMETAETAFRNYLEKLDQVARLEIVGMYHQVEAVQEGKVAVDILHVFGRTLAEPHIYYYRRRVDSAYWTAWERVDLDIQGDHLVPVVWNRRLYLFWATFTEKARPFQLSVPPLAPGTTVPGPQTEWEGKLSWSERKQGKWTSKKVSNESFPPILKIATLTSETSMSFVRSVIGADNKLTLVILSSDLIHHVVGPVGIVGLRFDDCYSDPRRGHVTLNLGAPLTGTDVDRMFLKEVIEPDDGGTELFLPAPADTVALKKTPGIFRLLPHHDGASIARHPFFYWDDTRTFCVVPAAAPGTLLSQDKNQLDLTTLFNVAAPYYSAQNFFATDTTASSVSSADLLFQSTFPIKRDPTGATSVKWPTHTVNTHYRFEIFYHPYVSAFVHELNRNGLDGMLQRLVQTDPARFLPHAPSAPAPQPLNFLTDYQPQPPIVDLLLYPKEDVDFEYNGAYSLYNWELFFHAPLMIADRLSKNQRFEEAQKWFHYIFDPTDASDGPPPQRYWHTKKFFETTREDYDAQRIQEILRLLAAAMDPIQLAGLGREARIDLANHQNAVKDWRAHPFQPHMVARLRTTAYQKTVVMKYLDNLIAWGDQLFRRDTIESINEATQLYILAAEILGQRPESIPARAIPRVQTYNSLEPKLDAFSDALVQIEEFVSPSGGSGVVDPGAHAPVTLPAMMYFCVPKNDKLLGYWDTVADRLFKVRHCRNIEGVERQLPLFEPPIDPGLLVRAAAAGVDLSSALNDTNVALPYYRFNVLAQKAAELCADLKSLGAALLSALEKRDAEELTLIRAGHETSLLELVGQVKEKQLAEAEQNLVALRKTRALAEARYAHYQKLLGVIGSGVPVEGQTISEQTDSPLAATLATEGVKMIGNEQAEMAALERAHISQLIAEEFERHANIAHLIPNFHIQPWGLGATFGGPAIGTALATFASYFRTYAGEQTYQANRSAKIGQFVLRQHDWTLQNNLAAREIMQIDQQILAANIRVEIARKELANHHQQLNNAREVETYMRGKYTNQELYSWMAGQVAGVYFQAYQLAFDVAKRAERAYRHELGLNDSNFVRFGYWDSLKKGLLAGEKLYQDLKRMEVAYLDLNKREYEITKHISLAQLDPIALLRLKQTGECFVSIPEALFDIDFTGHYMRRIKAVSVTIPCVTGPYTGINCTLTLLKSSIRHSSALSGDLYARAANEQDSRFSDSFGAIQSIVTSSGQNDSGLFEQNLRDERYLPFEGNGAISEWRIELPAQFRQFDYDTISDVVLHMKYTARDGGATLKQHAETELQHEIDAMELEEERRGRFRLFSVRHEFPTEWHRFQEPADATAPQALHLDITSERFPLQTKYLDISVTRLDVFVKLQGGERMPDNIDVRLGSAATASSTFTRNDGPATGPQLWHAAIPLDAGEATVNLSSSWTLAFKTTGTTTAYRFPRGTPEDILIVCSYTTSRSGSG